jgi:hypothetical protein
MIKMRKKDKREVEKCPDCESPIFVDHPYTWCSNCGERLSEEIQLKLPKLDELRAILAIKIIRNPDLQDSSLTLPMDSIPTRGIMWKLRDRAARLRTFAGFIMCGIIFLVLVGIVIFLNAGYTAQQEASPITSKALKEVSGISESLQTISKSLDKGLSEDKSKAQLLAGAGWDPDKIRTTLDKIQSFENIVDKNISGLRQDLGDNKVVIPVLVSSVSQRIGIIVLLIFLLQILVPTYRYNHRLAAYYAARADALEILSKLPDNKLDSLVDILSPDSLDFGKTITSPTEHVLEVVKEAVKSGRSSADIK